MSNLSEIYLLVNNLEQAESCIAGALDIAISGDFMDSELYGRINRAKLRIAQGKPDQARKDLDRASALNKKVGRQDLIGGNQGLAEADKRQIVGLMIDRYMRKLL